VRPLLAAAAAACDRRDWSSALSIAQAAAELDPEDPEVLAMLDRAGAGMAAPASGGRRRVTVMFCDLVGSTEIASHLDPEDMRELLQAYHETCAEIVHRHEGHIAHLMGDGVLIYFGYPRAHEDDVLRAVLTARAIVESVARLGPPIRAGPWELEARIGIHTGVAVISDAGSGSWTRQGDLVGETPNLAARVQSAAPGGSVVVTAETLALVRDQLVVQALGPRRLKGIDRPVQLFQVLSVRTDDTEGGPEAADAVVIGRATERATLERVWQETWRRGGYVVIAGEPGIGKTHLVRYARRLVPEGGRSILLRCSALHSNTPLHPVAHLLLSLATSAQEPDGGPLDRLARITERVGLASDESLYLLARTCSVPWPAGRHVPDLQPDQARERTLVLLRAWIDVLAAEGPLMLIIEDLHWADPTTLDFLQRCVTEPGAHPILVLVTTRGDPDTVPGEATTVIELRALEAAESDALIDALTAGRLDQATRALIAERGDGVPLYIRELATMLGASHRSGSTESVTPVPPTLTDLLVAHLDSFPNERHVVEALAVLGRPASAELVATVTDHRAADVRRQLDLLEHGGILRRSPAPAHYEFHHALLRDAAYDVQLLAHRRELHRRVAGALQDRLHDDQAQELAHHYELAGEPREAVSHWMRAARAQASFAAHAEAIQSFESALLALSRLGDGFEDLELQARSGLAASLLAARGYTAPEVASAYGRVRELAVARNAELELSALYGLWAYYHVTGDAPASLETAETLLERAQSSHDDQAASAACAVLGYQLLRVGRPNEAVALLTRGQEWHCTEPLLPHHAGIGAGANLAMAQWLIGKFSAARRSIEDAVAAAETLNRPDAHFTRAYTHAFAAELFQVAGQPDLAARHAGRVVQVSDQFGFTSWLAAGMTNLKIGEALAGDLDAIPTIEHCLGAWRAAGARSSLTQFGLGLALAKRAAGRTEDAVATIDQALRDASASQELYLEPELHRVRGELLADSQSDDAADVAALRAALDAAAASGSTALLLRALVSSARRHRDLHERAAMVDAAAGILDSLDPTGEDPEPVLVEARSLIAREVAR
jgi:class 3 adenylate cyclase/predicted ATPase